MTQTDFLGASPKNKPRLFASENLIGKPPTLVTFLLIVRKRSPRGGIHLPARRYFVRPHGQTMLGFFPLPVTEANRLKNCLAFPERFSALDPCVGDGQRSHTCCVRRGLTAMELKSIPIAQNRRKLWRYKRFRRTRWRCVARRTRSRCSI